MNNKLPKLRNHSRRLAVTDVNEGMVQNPVTKIEPHIAAKLAKQRYHLVGEHVCQSLSLDETTLTADRSCYKEHSTA